MGGTAQARAQGVQWASSRHKAHARVPSARLGSTRHRRAQALVPRARLGSTRHQAPACAPSVQRARSRWQAQARVPSVLRASTLLRQTCRAVEVAVETALLRLYLRAPFPMAVATTETTSAAGGSSRHQAQRLECPFLPSTRRRVPTTCQSTSAKTRRASRGIVS